ncbi:MAG TPA: phosphatase PAP2 family protein, partial [Candidatus Paceibacterota bacterium]|nr:phosphatase PAP2 family protein [Candidatus Paceibacterota bacterium]
LFLLARNNWVRAIALLYAFFIATGAAIGFHWFSDVLAGVIFGSLAGYVVAKDFKRRTIPHS